MVKRNMLEEYLDVYLGNRTIKNYQMVVAAMLSASSGCENAFVAVDGEDKERVSIKTMEKEGLLFFPVFTSREQAARKPGNQIHEISLIKFLNEEMKRKTVNGVVLNCWDRGGCVIQNDYIVQMNQFLSRQEK